VSNLNCGSLDYIPALGEEKDVIGTGHRHCGVLLYDEKRHSELGYPDNLTPYSFGI
jgi:hypothetical protein